MKRISIPSPHHLIENRHLLRSIRQSLFNTGGKFGGESGKVNVLARPVTTCMKDVTHPLLYHCSEATWTHPLSKGQKSAQSPLSCPYGNFGFSNGVSPRLVTSLFFGTTTPPGTEKSEADPATLSSSTATSADKEPPPTKDVVWKKTPPRAVFPWRHSAAPLPRLISGTSEYADYGKTGKGVPRSSGVPFYIAILHGFAARQLGFNWFQILFLGRWWENDLAGQFSWAFERSLEALLASSFRVPLEEIQSELGGVEFNHTLPSSHDDAPATNTEDSFPSSQEKDTAHSDTNTDVEQNYDAVDHSNENDHDSVDLLAQQMLEPCLYKLYSNANRTSRGNIQIHLRTRAISSELINLHLIPILTRNTVRTHPNLEGAFQKLFSEVDKGNKTLDQKRQMIDDLSRRAKIDPKVAEHTVVAQVLVRCKEIFQVRSVDTGEVIQGDAEGKERDVDHLVRFEMVTTQKIGQEAVQGSWQITDWDDLLDGNIWY